MDGLRRRRQQRAYCEVALGKPWALVEEARGLVERLDIDLDQHRAKLAKPLQGIVVDARGLAIAEEDALPGQRHTDARTARHRLHNADRIRSRIGIGIVGPGRHRKRRHRIVDGEREHRDAVERTARRHHAPGRDHAEARFQPDDVVERRGDTPRSGGVGAECQRHQSRRDRHGRAGARPAGNELRIERIARHAVRRAHADQPGRELIQIGLADDDRAGMTQAAHRAGVDVGIVGEGRARRRRRQAFDVDIVLHRDRHAEQRKAARARVAAERPHLGDRIRLVAQADEDRRIGMRADARVALRDRVFGRGRPGTMVGHDLRGGLGHDQPLRSHHTIGNSSEINCAESVQMLCRICRRWTSVGHFARRCLGLEAGALARERLDAVLFPLALRARAARSAPSARSSRRACSRATAAFSVSGGSSSSSQIACARSMYSFVGSASGAIGCFCVASISIVDSEPAGPYCEPCTPPRYGGMLHVLDRIRAIRERPEDRVGALRIDVLAHRDHDLAALGTQARGAVQAAPDLRARRAARELHEHDRAAGS